MGDTGRQVSVLFNEPKLLKSSNAVNQAANNANVSVLFNEPKLLKWLNEPPGRYEVISFSALQRAEIAEMGTGEYGIRKRRDVSVLFNEPKLLK